MYQPRQSQDTSVKKYVYKTHYQIKKEETQIAPQGMLKHVYIKIEASPFCDDTKITKQEKQT
jgi:hypothetical protein